MDVSYLRVRMAVANIKTLFKITACKIGVVKIVRCQYIFL